MTTTNSIQYQDTFIREVRATYHPTETAPIAITEPEQATAFIRSILSDNSREHFVALYRDGSHRIACYSIVSIGTANACLVHPREVLQRAILCGAVLLLVAHNHPSGVLTPSREDINTTRLLRNACEAVGIKLLDHLIVSDTDYISIIES